MKNILIEKWLVVIEIFMVMILFEMFFLVRISDIVIILRVMVIKTLLILQITMVSINSIFVALLIQKLYQKQLSKFQVYDLDVGIMIFEKDINHLASTKNYFMIQKMM